MLLFNMHLLLSLLSSALALITLSTIRNLTIVTNEYRERIVSTGDVPYGLGNGKTGQSVLIDAGGADGEEVEETIAASLRMLCSDLLAELEKPLSSSSSSVSESGLPSQECVVVKDEFHGFLEATARFIWEIQQRQMVWRWRGGSRVFEGVGWLQGLWASRSTNSQNRSFIEQQLSMYKETNCFGKSINQEVLRRDVEIVEFLNDLMDEFY